MKISKNRHLRKAALWLLKIFNPGSINIRHPFTNKKLFVDAYMHKGYWYNGKNVEKETMNLFRCLINRGDTIIEAGGHIGFMTQYFSHITGGNGKVYVFEPAPGNSTYLRKNIALNSFKNIVLVEKAVSDVAGFANFYVENITGQNNSLIPDHAGPNSYNNLKDNKKKLILKVETIRLDDFVLQEKINKIDFIKVDIEAAELLALKGMMKMLNTFKPRIMLEVTRGQQEIFSILESCGYLVFDTKKNKLNEIKSGNIFGIHKFDMAGISIME